MLTLSPVDCADVAQDISMVWASEDKKEQKRRQHRIEMVQFRRKRKAKQEGLRGECNRLEEQVKQAASKVKALAACTSNGKDINMFADPLGDLFVEIEDLRLQNVALRKEIDIHRNYQQVLEEMTATEDAQEESILPPSLDELSSWRVRFPGSEPSFHFHPFTRDVFYATMDSCSLELNNPPTISLRGEFLGWNVRHATVSSAGEDHPLVAKSRFTKRIHSSLVAVDDVMSKEERDSWPVIVTPMNWGGVTHGHASTQVLQEFDDNSCVLVHNVRGPINLRYICFVQRHRWTEREKKRVITYTMKIADSEANKRSRSAEANDEEVQWITEGGAVLSIMEVDDRTVDAVYDHWGGCESALHAQYLFVQWAQYALRWEQMVVPSKLLPA